MFQSSEQHPALLTTAVLAAVLTGCGGGSSTRMDSDSGTNGDGQPLTVPEGLVRSTVDPLFFTDDDTDIDILTFPTLASGIHRDYDEQRSELAKDAYVKSLKFDLEADIDNDIDYDGDIDGDIVGGRVTYVVGGKEVTVQFTDADRDTPDYGPSWTKTIDGTEYWGWLYWGNERQEHGFAFIGGIPGYRLYAHFGERTEAADLPSGTAVYEGGMRGDTHLTNDPSLSGRERMGGSLRLTANFDESSLEGRISDIRVRGQDESAWSNLPGTTYFEIGHGQIVDGQFTASLTGMDSNAGTSSMNETVRDYEGSVLGEFYGPEALEVGGVLNASRDDRVMAGAFGGVKQQ